MEETIIILSFLIPDLITTNCFINDAWKKYIPSINCHSTHPIPLKHVHVCP